MTLIVCSQLEGSPQWSASAKLVAEAFPRQHLPRECREALWGRGAARQRCRFIANPVKMLSGILKKWLQRTISESVAEHITSLFLKFLERASEQVQVNEKQTATHIFLERVKNQFLSLPSTLSLQAGIW